MNLDQLSQLLEDAIPPLDSWDPDFCGDMPIEIKKDGSWHYMNSPINRTTMVRLFSRVLIFESGAYYLKTPIEKVKIEVEDAPFVITDWNWQESEKDNILCCIDNLGRKHLLGKNHPLVLKCDPLAKTKDIKRPYLTLNFGLTAKISRNVYYQWAEFAQEINSKFFIYSAGEKFQLG